MRFYGKWAGNERGVAENKLLCIAEVSPPRGCGWIPRQCSRRRGCGQDGLFCAQHAKHGVHLRYPDDEKGAKS